MNGYTEPDYCVDQGFTKKILLGGATTMLEVELRRDLTVIDPALVARLEASNARMNGPRYKPSPRPLRRYIALSASAAIKGTNGIDYLLCYVEDEDHLLTMDLARLAALEDGTEFKFKELGLRYHEVVAWHSTGYTRTGGVKLY